MGNSNFGGKKSFTSGFLKAFDQIGYLEKLNRVSHFVELTFEQINGNSWLVNFRCQSVTPFKKQCNVVFRELEGWKLKLTISLSNCKQIMQQGLKM